MPVKACQICMSATLVSPDDNLMVVVFDECFFVRAKRGALLQPLLQVDLQSLHFPRQAVDSLLLDVSLEFSSDAVRLRRGCRSFTWQGILSTRNDCRHYFCHMTPVELHNTPTLWCFDPHAISDLVKLELSSECQPLIHLIRISGSC